MWFEGTASIRCCDDPRPRPPIACSTVSVFTTPLHDAFPLFAEAGFDGVEIMVTTDPDTQDAGRVADLSERHGCRSSPCTPRSC